MNAAAKKIKNIHFVGVKGVGMAPLAIIAKEAGFKVTGCDVSEQFITDDLLKKAGVEFYESFSNDHIKGSGFDYIYRRTRRRPKPRSS